MRIALRRVPLHDTEHQVDSTLDDEWIASFKEQISNSTREAGASPSAQPTSIKTSRVPLATIHRLADWRYLAFVGSLLAASIGVAAWWWSSSVDTAMMAPSDPAPLTQAAPEAALPKDVAPTAVALSSELAHQLQPMTRDLAALRQTVEQLEVRQEQLVRDNENLASQLEASREEVARNKSIIDQIKATQIQMTRESQTLTERLNASQEQLARVIANASEPKAMPGAPKVMPEEPKVSPEEPKATPEIPLPRPRQVAQTQKPAPTRARPQAKKPQPSSAWPWSVR
jgi:endonuclease/exonuclease/phosphatase (EEP) superfamily protein YafD